MCDIYAVYKIFVRIMRENGRVVSLPAHTDHQKTYAWRYLSNFITEMHKLHVPPVMVPTIISKLVNRAKKDKAICRGFAILACSDKIKLVIDELEKRALEEKEFDKLLTASIECLNGDLSTLAIRRDKNSYTNMTKWYEQGKLSKEFVSISESCQRILQRISGEERSLFPDPLEILKIRFKILSNDQLYAKASNILGSDLINS